MNRAMPRLVTVPKDQRPSVTAKPLIELVGPEGFEPSTNGLREGSLPFSMLAIGHTHRNHRETLGLLTEAWINVGAYLTATASAPKSQAASPIRQLPPTRPHVNLRRTKQQESREMLGQARRARGRDGLSETLRSTIEELALRPWSRDCCALLHFESFAGACCLLPKSTLQPAIERGWRDPISARSGQVRRHRPTSVRTSSPS